VIDFVHLDKERVNDIVPDEFEMRMGEKMPDVILVSREKIIHTKNIFAPSHKKFTQMTSQKSRSARD
jgi:hypothetical protein